MAAAAAEQEDQEETGSRWGRASILPTTVTIRRHSSHRTCSRTKFRPRTSTRRRRSIVGTTPGTPLR
jgi:hypothetical protein